VHLVGFIIRRNLFIYLDFIILLCSAEKTVFNWTVANLNPSIFILGFEISVSKFSELILSTRQFR